MKKYIFAIFISLSATGYGFPSEARGSHESSHEQRLFRVFEEEDEVGDFNSVLLLQTRVELKVQENATDDSFLHSKHHDTDDSLLHSKHHDSLNVKSNLPATPEKITETDLERKHHDSLNVKSGLLTTPEKMTETEMEPNFQIQELTFMEIARIMKQLRFRHVIAAAISLPQASSTGSVLVCCVIVPVVVGIIVILSSSSAGGSQEGKAPTFELDWRHLALCVSVSMLGPISTDIIVPAFPEIAQDIHASQYMTSLSMTVNMVARGASLIIAGYLSDNIGQRKIMLSCLLLYFGGSIICSKAPNIHAMLIGRTMQGIGESADAVVQGVVRASIEDEHRRLRVGSLMMSMQPVCIIVAPLVGSILTTCLGWRSIYYFLILWALGCLVAYLLIFPETRNDAPKMALSEQFSVVLFNRGAMFLLLSMSLLFTQGTSMILNISFVLDDFGIATLGKGVLIASMPIFIGLGATVTAKVLEIPDHSLHYTLRRAMCLQGIVVAPMMLLGMTFVHVKFLILLAFQSITFGMGLCIPAFGTLYMQPLKRVSGLASGMDSGVQMLVSGWLSQFSSSELETHGIRMMFMVMMVFLLIQHAVYWVGSFLNHEKWINAEFHHGKADDAEQVPPETCLESHPSTPQ